MSTLRHECARKEDLNRGFSILPSFVLLKSEFSLGMVHLTCGLGAVYLNLGARKTQSEQVSTPFDLAISLISGPIRTGKSLPEALQIGASHELDVGGVFL